MNNFKIEEFNCPCCGHNEMKPKFLDMIDEARRIKGSVYTNVAADPGAAKVETDGI